MSDIAIKTSGISKKFGDFKAVNKVSITVPKGSIYGLIGRNGAGKTTLMRCLLGLIKTNEGTIELLGKSGNGLYEARSKTGFIIESPSFYEKMSAYDNLMIRAIMIGIENPHDKIIEALSKVGLLGKEKNKVKNFSLGMKQNLGIAAAIMGDPELLILDEPVNGLDPIAIVTVREILLELSKKGTTIIISSHILSEIQKLCTCYGFLVDGKLAKEIDEETLKKETIDLEKLFVDLAKGV